MKHEMTYEEEEQALYERMQSESYCPELTPEQIEQGRKNREAIKQRAKELLRQQEYDV